MSLAEPRGEDRYLIVGMLCVLRSEGKSDKEAAERLRFGSVEEMRKQLADWKIPDWLAGTEPVSKSVARKKSARRLRNLGPVTELPQAGNATELFKERLEALSEGAEHIKHMNEALRGKYFVLNNVDTTPVFFSKEHMPEDVWETVREQYDLGPDETSFFDMNAKSRFPGGIAKSPSDLEANLIAVYALSGGRMDVLLDALHPDPLTVEPGALEGIRQCIDGSRAAGDARDGLRVLARQLATWVRGGEVRQGRPAGLSEMEHGLACRITQHRKDGLADEEIADRLSHYKKEDGTSYGIKDVVELGDLGLNWS